MLRLLWNISSTTSPLYLAMACLSIEQYRSNPIAITWPLCCVPRMLPAPRISRSRSAILNPAPSEEYCLMALIRFRASPTVSIERGSSRYAYALWSLRPTRPRSW